MLFIYDKKSKTVKPCSETNLRVYNLLERQDLEKWIELYPEMLGEDLLILTTEYDKFDKTNERIDILAIDKEGNLVIAELKREDYTAPR
jgi:RecB family endonuclease NucS